MRGVLVRTVLTGLLPVGLLLAGCHEPGHGGGSYSVRESGVRLRGGGPACAATPGTRTCPTVLFGLNEGSRVRPVCQRRGETVGSNPYWLYVDAPRGNRGWMASWFLDYPNNRLSGVPECTAALLAG